MMKPGRVAARIAAGLFTLGLSAALLISPLAAQTQHMGNPSPGDAIVAEDALPFAISLEEGGEELWLIGDIEMETVGAFRSALGSAPNLKRIVLDSPGGIIIAAQLMARSIRERGVATHVNGLCASACTIMFLAGSARTLGSGAKLGFHKGAHRADKRDKYKLSDALTDRMMMDFYRQAGLSSTFIDRVIATPNANLWLPDAATLLREKVITALPVPDAPGPVADQANKPPAKTAVR